MKRGTSSCSSAKAGVQEPQAARGRLWVPASAGTLSRTRESGFTLIEVMISLMIFGMLAAAGVALLSFSVRAQSATGAKLDDVQALNRLSSALSADLAQAETRPTGDSRIVRIDVEVMDSAGSRQGHLTVVRAGTVGGAAS